MSEFDKRKLKNYLLLIYLNLACGCLNLFNLIVNLDNPNSITLLVIISLGTLYTFSMVIRYFIKRRKMKTEVYANAFMEM